MSDELSTVTLTVTLHPHGALALAQILERAQRSKLSHEALNLITPDELHEAEIALEALRRALAEQGFDPR